jgi:hypothetical protein
MVLFSKQITFLCYNWIGFEIVTNRNRCILWNRLGWSDYSCTVEVLSGSCFSGWRSLSLVIFESGLRFWRIGKYAFFITGLVEIILFSSVEVLSMALLWMQIAFFYRPAYKVPHAWNSPHHDHPINKKSGRYLEPKSPIWNIRRSILLGLIYSISDFHSPRCDTALVSRPA